MSNETTGGNDWLDRIAAGIDDCPLALNSCEFLFGLCFCDHCRAKAADAGIDVERARDVVRDAIDGIVAGAVSASIETGAWLRTNPAVDDYLVARRETLTSLYAELAGATDSDLGYYFGLLDVDRTWMHGVDGHALAEHLDYYLVPAYESSGDKALATMAGADALTPDIPLHTGVLPEHPAIEDPGTLTDVVTKLANAGTPRLSFTIRPPPGGKPNSGSNRRLALPRRR